VVESRTATKKAFMNFFLRHARAKRHAIPLAGGGPACLRSIAGSRAAALDLPDLQDSPPYPVMLSAR
jgi:hypothetical protein